MSNKKGKHSDINFASKTEVESISYHTGDGSLDRPGKIEITLTKKLAKKEDLALAYSPGVAGPCRVIAKDKNAVYDLTAKGNLVAVISNGTAILGLGNLGPEASKPVMEGKAMLFKAFADIDAFDLELKGTDVNKLAEVIMALEPTFGGINLEDIKAPECFELEAILTQEMEIPVFHDDQHGTAVVASAGLLNALFLVDKDISDVKVVFSGAGASAIATAKMFISLGVRKDNLFMFDSKGLITEKRDNLTKEKLLFAQKHSDSISLKEVISGADVFVGLSGPGVLTKDMVKTMADKAVVFAMANPTPEILPEEVYAVRKDIIVGTGRSDYKNQVNNALGFPFIFRGALDSRARRISEGMKMAAAMAIAKVCRKNWPKDIAKGKRKPSVEELTSIAIVPAPTDKNLLLEVPFAVFESASKEGIARKDFNEKEYKNYLKKISKKVKL